MNTLNTLAEQFPQLYTLHKGMCIHLKEQRKEQIQSTANKALTHQNALEQSHCSWVACHPQAYQVPTQLPEFYKENEQT